MRWLERPAGRARAVGSWARKVQQVFAWQLSVGLWSPGRWQGSDVKQ